MHKSFAAKVNVSNLKMITREARLSSVPFGPALSFSAGLVPSSSMSFERYSIDHDDNLFPLLYQSAKWENFSKCRQIANLYRPDNDGIPLIRTTTVYQNPSQPMSDVHQTVIDKIRQVSGIADLVLNNAMLEVYNWRYKTMGFHTDQATDMAENSYICLFSCYEQGPDDFPRILTVMNKESEAEIDVELLHHSVVVFSTATNRRHKHKIERRDLPNNHANRWMGLTLRLAKNKVNFVDGVPQIVSNGTNHGPLTMATDNEKGDFFKLKGRENREVDFSWPEINYTISPSDLMPPTTTQQLH